MAEDLKEKIYEFLKENKPKKFSVLAIKNKIGYSYNTCLKWITVLEAEKDRKPLVVIEDYGNIKLVGVQE